MDDTQKKRQRENGGCLRRSMKILGGLVLAVGIILGALFITGKLLTSRLETEPDPHALAPWGPGTCDVKRAQTSCY